MKRLYPLLTLLTLPGCTTAAVTIPGGRSLVTNVTIDYTYDAAGRLARKVLGNLPDPNLPGTTDVTSQVKSGVYTLTGVTADHSLLATFAPVVTVTRYEQTSSLLKYVGTWTRVSTSKASGGSYSYTNTANGSVTSRE